MLRKAVLKERESEVGNRPACTRSGYQHGRRHKKQQERNQGQKLNKLPVVRSRRAPPCSPPPGDMASPARRASSCLGPRRSRVQAPGLVPSDAQFLPVSRSGLGHPVSLPGWGGMRPRAGLSRENTT